MIKVELIPALADNYIFAVPAPDSDGILVVDPGEAAPVLRFIEKHERRLSHILITHHHPDHVGGVKELQERTGARAFGPTSAQPLREGDTVEFGPYSFTALKAPGHTLDQTLFIEKTEQILFCGDTLFSLGCGRVFEGTYAQMFETLQRLKALPPTAKIYGAHEYTLKNVEFSLAYLQARGATAAELKPYKNLHEQIAVMREQNQPTIPSRLGFELKYNLFLKAATLEEFSRVRDARNSF